MKFGVGDFSGQRPPGSAPVHRELYARLQEQARQIDASGLDSMWISEHHFAEDGYMAAVLPIAAALLAATERITVGTDRLLASLYNPVRLAEDAIALDLLSGGRFVLGLSRTYRDEEFAGFGLDRITDAARLEGLAVQLRRAFTGQLRVTPGPYTPGGPPLLIAADGADGAVLAARLGDLLMIDPTEPWEALDQAVADFDRTRGDQLGIIAPFVYGGLSEDGEEAAWAAVADGFRYMRHNYDRWMGREPTPDLPPAGYRLLLGTPSQVARQALDYRLRYGDRVHLVLRCNYPGMHPVAVEEQIRLWSEAAARARSV